MTYSNWLVGGVSSILVLAVGPAVAANGALAAVSDEIKTTAASPAEIILASQKQNSSLDVVVNLSTNTLTVYDSSDSVYSDDSGFAWKDVRVISGPVSRRLIGKSYQIDPGDMAYNPSWSLKGEYIAADDPTNPIGDYWIAVDGNGIGLHHTNPAGIALFNLPAEERYLSKGCIRVELMPKLFSLLSVGDTMSFID